MDEAFLEKLFHEHANTPALPSRVQVCNWLGGMLRLLFPELADQRYGSEARLRHHYEGLRLDLLSLVRRVEGRMEHSAEEIVAELLDGLPSVRARLLADADAICAGDPAAVDRTEVVRTYPGFHAIAVYRLAHAFQRLGVPLIPRILTEDAHGRTGIDIHPGARIGERFCIDHGTGIVIGETCQIGDDVKLYQGVTLGALSVRKEMARQKRHPTIEDGVVVYAGATILGGDTVVGRGSVIGGNVWLTESVPPGSRVYYRAEASRSSHDPGGPGGTGR